MKKFLTTAFLFTLAVAAFAQGAPAPVQKSLFEGQFVAHLSLAIAATINRAPFSASVSWITSPSPSPPPAAVSVRARP